MTFKPLTIDLQERLEAEYFAAIDKVQILTRQRIELRAVMLGIRGRMLMAMESEGFNQDTDDSWILDAIDEALANTEKDTP